MSGSTLSVKDKSLIPELMKDKTVNQTLTITLGPDDATNVSKDKEYSPNKFIEQLNVYYE